MANKFDLKPGERAERKKLITVAEWLDAEGTIYAKQFKKPADWDTNYTAYYTKSGSDYTAVTGSTAPAWNANDYYSRVSREIMGTRTEDSSIEFNPDIETSTDIRGNNYTDLNKTQPEQSFDPYLVLGGSTLGPKIHDIMFRNALSELNQFNVYIITAYIYEEGVGYSAQLQEECTVTYESLGGDVNVNMPLTIHYSNKCTAGVVDKLADDFEFTPDANV